MRLAKFVVVGAAAMVGASCAATPHEYTGPVTAEQRTIILRHIRTSFFDPYSIRDASIATGTAGAPILTPNLGSCRSGGDPKMRCNVVCVRANAKNRYGAYTGQSVTAYVIQKEKVVNVLDETGAMFCRGAKWSPFPEAEAI